MNKGEDEKPGLPHSVSMEIPLCKLVWILRTSALGEAPIEDLLGENEDNIMSNKGSILKCGSTFITCN